MTLGCGISDSFLCNCGSGASPEADVICSVERRETGILSAPSSRSFPDFLPCLGLSRLRKRAKLGVPRRPRNRFFAKGASAALLLDSKDTLSPSTEVVIVVTTECPRSWAEKKRASLAERGATIRLLIEPSVMPVEIAFKLTVEPPSFFFCDFFDPPIYRGKQKRAYICIQPTPNHKNLKKVGLCFSTDKIAGKQQTNNN